MANVKILDLSDLTSPTSSDVLPIVDVSASITKRTTLGRLLQKASNGTASSPSISFDSDSDTGFYRIGSNKIGITANGYRVGINSNGINVGGGDINTPNLQLRTDGDVICSTVNAIDDITVDRTQANNTAFRARLNGVTTFKVAANGNTEFAGSVSIGGTAAANTIDEYEEGTWTPTVTEFGGGASIPFTLSNANYVRIGNQVTMQFRIILTSASNGATINPVIQGANVFGTPKSRSMAMITTTNSVSVGIGYTSNNSFVFRGGNGGQVTCGSVDSEELNFATTYII